jgi:signal transduction histidine kinase/PAS domain-containing protein
MYETREPQTGSPDDIVLRSYDLLIDHFNIIGEKIASSYGVEQTLEQIAESACHILRANPVILFQFDNDKARLLPPPIYAGKLFEETDYASTFVFSGRSFAEMIIKNGESLYLERAEDIDRHPSMVTGRKHIVNGMPPKRFHEREQVKSMAALVLKAGDETVGLMCVNYRTQLKFSEPIKKLMKAFGSYAAIAIKNSRLIERFRQNEAFQKRIVDRIPDPVFVTRNKKVDGKLVWRIDVANRAAYELFGYDYQLREFTGIDARELLRNELDRLRDAFHEGDGEVSNFEVLMLNKNGESIPIRISTAILEKDEANHITRTICIAKDLSKRKILETQLEHLNQATISLLNAESLDEAYSAIFENLSQIGYDKGMISLVDEAARTIVGKKATGRGWTELQKKTNVSLKSNDILARVVKSGTPQFIEDCITNPYCDQEVIRHAGIKSQYIIPLIVQEKVIGALQIGFSDKQDLLRGDKYYLNESLKILSGFANQVAVAIETNRHKIRVEKLRTTLADIGHEFRSPLHNIISQLGGLIYYLKKSYGDDQKVMKTAKIIQEETFRAERQMRNALFSAQESLEGTEQYFEQSHIHETIALCADRFRETAQKRGIKIIIYDSVRKLPAISYDKTQIEQVFTNLIDNAVKYSYAHQNIEIRGTDLGRKVEISFKDMGVGIPQRLQERIFEGFSRSEIKDSTRYIPGTGLGLKIAKKFVEDHKGKILVSSKPYFQDPQKIMNYEGYTTIFMVILPKNPKEF